MAGVPYTFGSATSSIPLSQLDSNFTTPVTIGTTTVALGNTVTTLANVTVSNVTVSSAATPIPEAAGGTGSTVGWNDFKNRIINGAMGIWQRGTSFTSGGSSTYTADRFFGNGSSGTISRSTDVPAGFTYSFSNAASSTAYPGVDQRIESANIADCASQTITVSFYVKQTSGTASALNINLSYPNAVDNYSSSTTIVETNVVASMPSSWTRYSYTYTLPANVTNGLSVTLFVPSASITATFLITGVQLEKGSTATSFDYRPYGTELFLCYRYFQKSFALGTAPANGLSEYGNSANTTSYATAVPYIYVKYQVQLRATPSTVNFYNPRSGGTAGQITNSASDGSGTALVNSGEKGFMVQSASQAANNWYVHWDASSEL
jgi:hypothetical protein